MQLFFKKQMIWLKSEEWFKIMWSISALLGS